MNFEDGAGGAGAGSRLAQGIDDLGEALFDFGAALRVAKEWENRVVEIFGSGLALDEFGVDNGVSQEVGHGEVLHLDEAAAEEIGAPGGFVEDDGGDTEVGALHGDGARRGDGCGGGLEGRGEVANLDVDALEIGKRGGEGLEGWVGENHGDREGGFIGLDAAGGFNHGREVLAEFADAAAGKKEEGGVGGWSGSGVFGGEPIDERMADEFDFEVRFARVVPCLFERKDGEHEVDIAGDLVDARFVPGPDLRGDVIDDFGVPG